MKEGKGEGDASLNPLVCISQPRPLLPSSNAQRTCSHAHRAVPKRFADGVIETGQLSSAARSGDVVEMQALIRAGANVNEVRSHPLGVSSSLST